MELWTVVRGYFSSLLYQRSWGFVKSVIIFPWSFKPRESVIVKVSKRSLSAKKNKVVGIPFLTTHLKEFFEYLAHLLSYTHFILSIIPLISLYRMFSLKMMFTFSRGIVLYHIYSDQTQSILNIFHRDLYVQ